MTREECAKGFVVSVDYSSDALTEIGRFFKQTRRVIVPLTVRDILDEQIAHKLAQAGEGGFGGRRQAPGSALSPRNAAGCAARRSRRRNPPTPTPQVP